MSYIKKILIVVALLGLVFCGVKVYGIVQSFSGPNTAFNNEEAYIYISSKTDANTLKNELFPLIKDEESFKQVAKRLGYDQVKAGKYTIKKGMSNLDIVRVLKGKSDLISVVIPENKTHRELAKIISNQIEATESDVYKIFTETINMEDIKVYNMSFESFLIPGTYKMPWSTSAIAFRDFMIKNNQKQNQ